MEDVTGTPGDLIKGKSAYLQGSDEPQTGTLELTGNATDGYVYSGKTYYNTDAKMKRTGTMTVNSLLSFSAAAYSGRRVLAKWQNPKAASGKPYSGVYIRYSTSGNPGKTGGNQIYKGAGNNTASEGQSQAYLDLPALSTKYYLSLYPYATCSAGEMTGAVINAVVTTSAVINKTFTVSGTYTVPAGYNKMDACYVGGGGSSYNKNDSASGFSAGGGGGGYVVNNYSVFVTPGATLNIIVGAGGVSGGNGGASYISGIGVAAGGGKGCIRTSSLSGDKFYAGNGGSGGGAGGNSSNPGSNGGSNGGSGGNNGDSYAGGTGQGTSTRAWGSGTLYAGGGGGGGWTTKDIAGGYGGAGGGGNGSGCYSWYEYSWPTPGTSNTGGGAGGANARGYDGSGHGKDESLNVAGGSGIVLLKLY